MNTMYKKLMTHRATIRQLGRNVEGDWITVATHMNIPCLFQWGTKIVRNNKGEEVTVSAIVFMYPDAPVDDSGDDVYWEIEQTHPYSRAEANVIRVDPIDDPRIGITHHKEVAIE